MTPNQKAAVVVSALILIGGAGYLYYEFVYKPGQAKKANSDKPETPSAPAPVVPAAPVSQYGFKPGDLLYTKSDIVNVYSYPEASAKYRVGFIKKQAQSQAKFLADAGTKGFVKANTNYFTTDGKAKKIADVFIPADQLTNVAP